eukprot:COSAG03_NODE_2024_length_3207_cov_1.806950_2_plen_90_part_00
MSHSSVGQAAIALRLLRRDGGGTHFFRRTAALGHAVSQRCKRAFRLMDVYGAVAIDQVRALAKSHDVEGEWRNERVFKIVASSFFSLFG